MHAILAVLLAPFCPLFLALKRNDYQPLHAFALLLLLMGSTPAYPADDFIVTKLIPGELSHYDESQLNSLMKNFRDGGINTVSVIVAWSVVEPVADAFDFSAYAHHLDRLVEAGFNVLLIIDSSGRPLVSPTNTLLDQNALPEWVKARWPNVLARDFSGHPGINIDFHDRDHFPALERFYQRTLTVMAQRYGDAIIGVAPGIMHELELKYAQQGYRWQSYSAAAQADFAGWLAARGQAVVELPIINYANQTGQGAPRIEPNYANLMTFREQAVRNYVCRLTGVIRAHGQAAAGYFGQALSAHDAIYALGVIEQLTDCLDKITVDYNYFDGWQVELNPYVLPLLVNYAHNLGYSQVLAGIYLEVLYGADGQFTHDPRPLVRETIRLLGQQAPPVGLEIGNVRLREIAILKEFGLEQLNQHAAPSRNVSGRYKIAVAASIWTYYLWVGEHWQLRNIIQDSLIASFKLLLEHPEFDVQILGDSALSTQSLDSFDALFLPHQTTLSPAAIDAIKHYHANGGRLAQDVRFSAFDRSGIPTLDWQNALFGIGGVGWRNNDALFIVRLGDRPRRVELPIQTRSYFSHALLAPQTGHRLLMPRFNDPNVGLMLRGPRTLTYGFMPHLVVDHQKGTYWEELFIAGLRDLIEND